MLPHCGVKQRQCRLTGQYGYGCIYTYALPVLRHMYPIPQLINTRIHIPQLSLLRSRLAMRSVLLTVLFAFTAPFVSAHPGPHHLQTRSEIARRAELSKRCPGQAATFNALRQKRAVEKRSILSPHGSLAPRGINGTNVTIYTESPHYDTIQNDTCVLAPEIYAGPYLWPRSQTLRQDMSEDQAGVPLYLDIGVLNVNTCEPLPEVLVDLWHCNAVSVAAFSCKSMK